MKPYQVMMYFLLVNGMFNFFTILGAYGYAAAVGVDSSLWLQPDPGSFIATVSSIQNVATVGLALFTSAILFKAGISPFLTIAYGLFAGLFVNTTITVSKVLYSIASLPELADSKGMLIAWIGLILTVYAFSVLFSMIQMSTGGTETYE